eukprot:TRINITY_DN3897_c0_g1_i2.p1 TRINITY_DN3897_c0_g1~~TRINITY_DN3897_c0_g1_i2.p1  ORF type:complete len:394 (-),score=57.63 TRINITY_DN3897_c0_g1_i2:123-1304(-)
MDPSYKIEGSISSNVNKTEKSVSEPKSDDVHLFPGEPIICQLIQAANLFQKLSLEDILSLTLTSQQILKQLSPFISNYYFLRYHEKSSIQNFHPKKLLITTHNLEKLFSNSLLSNLREVIFDVYYNFEVPKLPDSVTHITFKKYFNSEITKLPPHLTFLEFTSTYNLPLPTENFPRTLTHLYLGNYFNKPIHALSQMHNLTHIKFGIYFAEPIDHLLPVQLKHITFHPLSFFNHSINHLPLCLTYLFMGTDFDQQIDELPSHLTHLIFSTNSRFNRTLSKLPNSLTHITLGQFFVQPIDQLSLNITNLSFCRMSRFNQPLSNLPTKLIDLQLLGPDFLQYIPSLPVSVQSITFSDKYDLPIDHLSKAIQFQMKTWQNGEWVVKPYEHQPEEYE